MAFCASSSVLISTNAKPRALPVAMSRITLTVSTVPERAKSSWSSVSPVSYGKFPTYNLRPITDSSVASATSATECGARVPTVRRTAGGFRLVARQNVRRSESGRGSLRPTGSTARGKIRKNDCLCRRFANGLRLVDRVKHLCHRRRWRTKPDKQHDARRRHAEREQQRRGGSPRAHRHAAGNHEGQRRKPDATHKPRPRSSVQHDVA